MAADIERLIDENPTEITIRRGSSTLAAQTVRIERVGGKGLERRSAGAAEVLQVVLVLGESDLDIQVGDRFNDDNDVLYEVTFVRPNRLACVQAEARQVE